MRRDPLPDLVNLNTASEPERSDKWRLALPLLTGSLVWVLAFYASTVNSMVEIWSRSGTFAHGFLILPIVLWLVWDKRAELAMLTPRPSWWAVLCIAGVGFIWLVGELAIVNAVSQLALTAILVLTVIGLLGTSVARRLAFPLAFLFFAVLIGEFMVPQLMQWTADVTVLALRLSGIPVYREGMQFVIPSGNWSVVETCSGLRYLVAASMVGTLYAYLTYRSLTRRLVFVGVTILVAILANWVRAYMIVMLGHLTNNELATRADHVVYGWLLFGAVMAALFWFGGRWREDIVAAASSKTSQATAVSAAPAAKLWAAAAAVAVVTLVWRIGYWGIDSGDVAVQPKLAVAPAIGAWQPLPETVIAWRPHYENASAELQQAFRNDDRRVGLFLGYYRNQGADRKLVSSESTLTAKDDPLWATVDGGVRDVSFNGRPLAVRVSEVRRVDGRRLVVWRWYWINGHLTAFEPWAKVHTAWSRFKGQGDDSSVIIVYASPEQPGGAENAIETFIRAAGPEIESALGRARNTR